MLKKHFRLKAGSRRLYYVHLKKLMSTESAQKNLLLYQFRALSEQFITFSPEKLKCINPIFCSTARKQLLYIGAQTFK